MEEGGEERWRRRQLKNLCSNYIINEDPEEEDLEGGRKESIHMRKKS